MTKSIAKAEMMRMQKMSTVMLKMTKSSIKMPVLKVMTTQKKLRRMLQLLNPRPKNLPKKTRGRTNPKIRKDRKSISQKKVKHKCSIKPRQNQRPRRKKKGLASRQVQEDLKKVPSTMMSIQKGTTMMKWKE